MLMLNTKGCCFFCLENVRNFSEDPHGGVFPLQVLLRHFHIDGNILPGDGSVSGGPSETPEINAELCKSCRKNCDRLSVLIQRLGKVQLEINYFLEQTHNRISDSNKSPGLVENYSRKMISDSETLSQLPFVDNLRTEIAKKSLKLQVGTRPQVELTRTIVRADHQVIIKNEGDGVMDTSYGIFQNEAPDEYLSNPDDELLQDLPSQFLSSLITFEETKFCPQINSPQSHCAPTQTAFKSKSSSASKTSSKAVAGKTRQPINRPPKRFFKDPLTGRYPCPSCDKTFNRNKYLRFHFMGIHEGKRWNCDVCNVTTCSDPSNLRKHRKRCLNKQQLSTVRHSGEDFANQRDCPAHLSNTDHVNFNVDFYV